MTAFSKTVTNVVNCFGCPADLWNAYTWGNFKWGSGTADLPVQVRHLVTNTLLPTIAQGQLVRHLVTNTLLPTIAQGQMVLHLVTNTLTLGDGTGPLTVTVANALAMAEDVAYLYVQDPNGYFKIFPENTANAHTQGLPAWAAPSPTTATWAAAAAGSTTWS